MDRWAVYAGKAGAGLVLTALAGAVPALSSPTRSLEKPPVPVVVIPPLGSGPRPLNDPATWVTPYDYPPQALRDNVEGATGFRLTVGPDGRVTDCVIASSAGAPVLDEAACRLVRLRAQFAPATDPSGKAVVGAYSNRIRWVIPRPPHPEAGELTISYLVAPDGSRSDCQVENATGGAVQVIAKAPPCAMQGGFLSGYKDADGKPVTRRVRSTVKIEVLPAP